MGVMDLGPMSGVCVGLRSRWGGVGEGEGGREDGFVAGMDLASAIRPHG